MNESTSSSNAESTLTEEESKQARRLLARVAFVGLALFRGENYDRESVDLVSEAPPPLVVEIAAATAKAVGEELRLVRSSEG